VEHFFCFILVLHFKNHEDAAIGSVFENSRHYTAICIKWAVLFVFTFSTQGFPTKKSERYVSPHFPQKLKDGKGL